MDFKTVGILCDNYKVEKFKQELIDNGFMNYFIMPSTKTLSHIQVKCLVEDYHKIAKICQSVESYFKIQKN